MNDFKIIVPNEPIARSSYMHYVKNGFVGTYDKQANLKKNVSNLIKSQVLNKEIIKGYLHVKLDFYFSFPKSLTKSNRNLAFWMEFPTKRDLDNLAKFYLDCCNNIVFNDDRQITSLTCRKFYSKNPRTEITIMPKETKIEEDVTKILSVYGQDEIIDFMEIAYELLQLYNIDDHHDWVKDQIQCADDEVKVVRITRTAYLLSKLAYGHADLLKKVHRKCPSFWRNAERIANQEKKKENDVES